MGCGHDRTKKIHLPGQPAWAGELVTLDMGPDCGADVVHDLEVRPLPFPDEHFDEIAAYDVLEHVGRQGDWRGYFDEFAEYWRILKPAGTFGIIVPTNKDALADPGHTRFFHANYFLMLSRKWYDTALSAGLQVTDYRWYWRHDFDPLSLHEIGDHHMAVMLRKVAPA